MPYDRAIFIYLEPRPQDRLGPFAQCGSCRMFIPAIKRCVIHGSKLTVDKNDSCGFYVPWPKGSPNPEVIADHQGEMEKGVGPSVEPEDSGFVDDLVQCQRCVHYSDQVCGLYTTLNSTNPSLFSLDTSVKPHGCCNAWSDEAPRSSTLLGSV